MNHFFSNLVIWHLTTPLLGKSVFANIIYLICAAILMGFWIKFLKQRGDAIDRKAGQPVMRSLFVHILQYANMVFAVCIILMALFRDAVTTLGFGLNVPDLVFAVAFQIVYTVFFFTVLLVAYILITVAGWIGKAARAFINDFGKETGARLIISLCIGVLASSFGNTLLFRHILGFSTAIAAWLWIDVIRMKKNRRQKREEQRLLDD